MLSSVNIVIEIRIIRSSNISQVRYYIIYLLLTYLREYLFSNFPFQYNYIGKYILIFVQIHFRIDFFSKSLYFNCQH